MLAVRKFCDPILTVFWDMKIPRIIDSLEKDTMVNNASYCQVVRQNFFIWMTLVFAFEQSHVKNENVKRNARKSLEFELYPLKDDHWELTCIFCGRISDKFYAVKEKYDLVINLVISHCIYRLTFINMCPPTNLPSNIVIISVSFFFLSGEWPFRFSARFQVNKLLFTHTHTHTHTCVYKCM